MLEKGFLKSQAHKNSRHKNVAATLSKTLLYLGVLILLVSFIYLLANLNQSDKLITIVLPFLVAGLGLIAVSQFIKRAYNKLHR